MYTRGFGSMDGVLDWAKEQAKLQIDKAVAAAQAEVGNFLGFKSRILQYVNSADKDVSAKANELLARQNQLEAELETNMQRIAVLKTIPLKDAASALPDAYRLYDFAKAMKQQKEDVANLERQAKGLAPQYASAGGIGKYALPVLGVVGLAFAVMKRRK